MEDGRVPVLHRVVLHDDYLEIRRFLRPSRQVPWPMVQGVRLIPYDGLSRQRWDADPARGRTVEIKLDGRWTRLTQLTLIPSRNELLSVQLGVRPDPRGRVAAGFALLRERWERGGGRPDSEDDVWLTF
jgi:hypothetical protein